MSCILIIEGENFRVNDFLESTKLKPYLKYEKGSPIGFKRYGKTLYETNGCKFDLSVADFDKFDIQKKDAINFLTANFDNLKLLSKFGLTSEEIPRIDFAIFTRMLDDNIAAQFEYLEPELLLLSGKLNFGIEISQYIPNEENESSEREK